MWIGRPQVGGGGEEQCHRGKRSQTEEGAWKGDRAGGRGLHSVAWPVGGTSAREEEIRGLPASGSLKCWAWMCDPKAKRRLQGTRTLTSKPWRSRRVLMTQTLSQAARFKSRPPPLFPDGKPTRVTSLVPRPSHLTNAGGNACGPTSWPGLQALII